jgi:hypothetical protein
MKLVITNASLVVTLRKRNGFYEFTNVMTNMSFDTKEEALAELRKFFGRRIKIKRI